MRINLALLHSCRIQVIHKARPFGKVLAQRGYVGKNTRKEAIRNDSKSVYRRYINVYCIVLRHAFYNQIEVLMSLCLL